MTWRRQTRPEKILTVDLEEYFKPKENFKPLKPRRKYYHGIEKTPIRTGWLQAIDRDVEVRIELQDLLSLLEQKDCSPRQVSGLVNLLLTQTELTPDQEDLVIDTFLRKKLKFEGRTPTEKEVSNRISKKIFDKNFDFFLKWISEVPKKMAQRFFYDFAGEEQKIRIFQTIEDIKLKTEFLKKLPKKYATDQLTSNLVDLRQEAKGIIVGKKIDFDKKLKTALGETFKELFPTGTRKKHTFAGVEFSGENTLVFNGLNVRKIFFRKFKGVYPKRDPNRFYLILEISCGYTPYRFSNRGEIIEKTGQLIKHEIKMGYGDGIVLSFPKTSWDIFNTWIKENLKSCILDHIQYGRFFR